MQRLYVKVKTTGQFQAATENRLVYAVICGPETIEQAVQDAGKGQKLFFALPDVLREKQERQWADLFEKVRHKIAGVLVENTDALGFLHAAAYEGSVIAGELLYCWNAESIRFLRSLFRDVRFMAPSELTLAELRRIEEEASVQYLYKIFGHQKLMVTAQCLYHSYDRCRSSERLVLTDQKKNRFFVQQDCALCGSQILNGQPTYMLDRLAELPSDQYYMEFTVESFSQAQKLLCLYESSLQKACAPTAPFTRGHSYKRTLE